jgi:hypothetical protein
MLRGPYKSVTVSLGAPCALADGVGTVRAAVGTRSTCGFEYVQKTRCENHMSIRLNTEHERIM